jgi:hypothetical protein
MYLWLEDIFQIPHGGGHFGEAYRNTNLTTFIIFVMYLKEKIQGQLENC